mgnify:CR=1 FL=1
MIAVIADVPAKCGVCASVIAALEKARNDMTLHSSAIEAAFINAATRPKLAAQIRTLADIQSLNAERASIFFVYPPSLTPGKGHVNPF